MFLNFVDCVNLSRSGILEVLYLEITERDPLEISGPSMARNITSARD